MPCTLCARFAANSADLLGEIVFSWTLVCPFSSENGWQSLYSSWKLHKPHHCLWPSHIRQEHALQLISLHCVRQLYKRVRRAMQTMKFLCLTISSRLPLLGTNDIHHCNIVQPQSKCNMLCLFNPRSFQKVDMIPLTKWTSRSSCCSTRLTEFGWKSSHRKYYGRDIWCMCLTLILLVCNLNKFWMQTLTNK